MAPCCREKAIISSNFSLISARTYLIPYTPPHPPALPLPQGLLFAIEEGTTHWFRGLVWRIFFCSIVTAFVLDFFLSGEGRRVCVVGVFGSNSCAR